MNVVKSYGAHLAAYLVSAATIVSGLDPALLPPQYASIIGIAGLVAAAAHNGHTVGAAGIQAAVAAATQALKTTAPALVLALLVAGSMTGCKTLPTPTEQAGITVAVEVATGAAIQSGEPQVAWQARAAKFKAIAVELKQVDDAGTATLATLSAALAPQIATLPPADQLAAHALVAALQPYLDKQAAENPSLGTTRELLDVILQAVIDACTAYGA